MRILPPAKDIVQRHLEAVRSNDFSVAVAQDSKWVWSTDFAHHPEPVGLAYRSITQAWDFPIVFYSLEDLGDGRVSAKLMLENGNKSRKNVIAEYQVDDGLIVHAILRDSEAVQNDG